MVVLGFPISWEKIQGGDSMAWVGYELLLKEHALGLSASRASWCVEWLRRLLRDGSARMSDFRAGLGRLSFACGALEYERPFLAPLHAFAALHEQDAHRPLPLFVMVVLEFLAERIARRRHYPSAEVRSKLAEAPRVDARAEGDAIGLGGWLPTRDGSGVIATSASPWFSFQLDRASAPWAYARNGQPYRSIASLEALAALTAVVAFGDAFPPSTDGTLLIPGVTDNRGNRYALSRLQGTRFPLSAVVMELSAQLETRGARLELAWVPRDLNSEADALSNGITDGFSEAARIPVDYGSMKWLILDRILEAGAAFEAERSARRARTATLHSAKRRAKKPGLKDTDPW